MLQIEQYSTELLKRNGIFFTKKESNISYPESGNDHCFQIEEDSFWFNHRNCCIVEAVKKYCPNDVFFDIGGGNGFVAKRLEEEGISTVLVEPGLTGCLNAKKRELNNIVCSTLENASFKKGTLPSAGLFDVVEHIEDDVQFLKSLFTFIRNDGYVFITVPAYNALWSHEDLIAGHYRRYTIGQMENKLRSAGFSIAYSTYIFSILPIPVFLFRTLPYKIGLNKESIDVEKHKNEHKRRNGFADKALNIVWNYEADKVRKGEKIGFGGSCLIVAKKM